MKGLNKKLRIIISIAACSFRAAPVESLGLLLVSGFSGAAPLVTAYLFKLLIDRLVGANLTFWIAVIPLFFYVSFRAFSRFLHTFRWSVLASIFRWKLQDKLWMELHKKLFSLDISHFENTDTFNIILRARDNANWRPYQLMDYFFALFGSVIGLVASLVVVAKFGFFIPLIVVLSVVPRFLLSLKFGEARWSIFDEGAESNKKMWYLSGLTTSAENIKELKVFKAEEKILGTMRKIREKFYLQNKKVALKYGLSSFFDFFIELMAIGYVLASQVPAVMVGAISVGDFSFILMAVFAISDAVGGFLIDISNAFSESFYVGYFFDLIDLKSQIKLPSKPKLPKSKTLAPKVEFVNVSFRYGDGLPYALKDISFIIEPGENVALVGENGAGKSTIIKLMMRFYDTTSGEVLINGENIKNIDLDWWYDQVGTLFQDFLHYNFSVKESISLEGKKANIGRIKKAAKLSGADVFIEEFPEKYDQMLGLGFEEGKELSGGQWQKIALARAFYKMPHLLVLDEPTSAIDAEAEYEIFKNINKIYKGEKSLLIVSHRFSTVRNAEKIIVLKEGGVKNIGTHKQLLKKGELYARMFDIQASGYR